jgi:hypothetical protein
MMVWEVWWFDGLGGLIWFVAPSQTVQTIQPPQPSNLPNHPTSQTFQPFPTNRCLLFLAV